MAQVKQQAPQQDRDKTEKQVRELTTDLAQVKQALQQDRDKAEKQVRDLATELAQVKQALQQRDKTEKQVRELDRGAGAGQAGAAAGPRQDREADPRPDHALAQVKAGAAAGPRQEPRSRSASLATELAQVKQALQQERDKTEKQTRELDRGPDAGQAGAASRRTSSRQHTASCWCRSAPATGRSKRS